MKFNIVGKEYNIISCLIQNNFLELASNNHVVHLND